MKLWSALLAAGLATFVTLPAIAADAASCSQCGNRCYTSPNPGACSQACTSYCIAQGDGGPKPYCGSVMVGSKYEEAMGWSWGAGDTATANRPHGTSAAGPKPRSALSSSSSATNALRSRDPVTQKASQSVRSRGRGAPLAEPERDAFDKCGRHAPKAASCKIEKRLCADRGPM